MGAMRRAGGQRAACGRLASAFGAGRRARGGKRVRARGVAEVCVSVSARPPSRHSSAAGTTWCLPAHGAACDRRPGLPESPSPLSVFWSFWTGPLVGEVRVQEIPAEPSQRGERGGAEYGVYSWPPFAENRLWAWVGGVPSLLFLPVHSTVGLDSLVLGPLEAGQYRNWLIVRTVASGRSPSAFSKLLPFCSRWLRLTGLNYQNGES